MDERELRSWDEIQERLADHRTPRRRTRPAPVAHRTQIVHLTVVVLAFVGAIPCLAFGKPGAATVALVFAAAVLTLRRHNFTRSAPSRGRAPGTGS